MNWAELNSWSILKACYFWMRTDSNIRSKTTERQHIRCGFFLTRSGNFGQTCIYLIWTTKPILRTWNFQSMFWLRTDKKSGNKNFKVYVGLRCDFLFHRSVEFGDWFYEFENLAPKVQIANFGYEFSVDSLWKHRKHSPRPSKCLGDPVESKVGRVDAQRVQTTRAGIQSRLSLFKLNF